MIGSAVSVACLAPQPGPVVTESDSTPLRLTFRRPGRPADTVQIDLVSMRGGYGEARANKRASYGGRMFARLPSGRTTVALHRVRRVGDSITARVHLPSGMDHLEVRLDGESVSARLFAPHDTFALVGSVSRLPPRTADSLRVALSLEPWAPGIISTDTTGESFSAVSPDGGMIVFTRHRADWSRHTLMSSSRIGRRWSTPTPLSFSGTHTDREPSFSPDGRTLWFSSDRPGAGEVASSPGQAQPPSQQIWQARMNSDGSWVQPRRLPAPVNVGASDMSPSMTQAGVLYFSSRRAGSLGRGDIFTTAYVSDGGSISEPRNVGPEINTAHGEPNVFVTADGMLMLYAASDRPGGLGWDDIYVSWLVDGRWTPGRLVGPPVSSFEADYGPSLSADGRSLYFTSHRFGTGDIFRVDARSVLGAPPGR